MTYITPADVPISDNWHDHRARGSKEPGTDYTCGYGTDLRAPASGVVLAVDRDPGGPAGRRLTLLLDDGRAVDWIHLDSIQANVGQRFGAGQTGLALSGASANGSDWGTDGAHVHVTLRADRWRDLADTLNFEDYLGGSGVGGGVVDAGGAVDGVIGPNPFGIPFTGGLQKIARLYGYTGELDQIFGAGSMAGFAQFLRVGWGYVGNDELGPVMWTAIQRWLQARWGYEGDIDGIPGPLTRAALSRADTANWDEL